MSEFAFLERRLDRLEKSVMDALKVLEAYLDTREERLLREVEPEASDEVAIVGTAPADHERFILFGTTGNVPFSIRRDRLESEAVVNRALRMAWRELRSGEARDA